MSGLGPAACWLAHKRIESWSRLAKERVGAVRKSTDKSDGSKASNASTSMNMSTDSNNDSFASTEDCTNHSHATVVTETPLPSLLSSTTTMTTTTPTTTSTAAQTFVPISHTAVNTIETSSSSSQSPSVLHSPLQHQSKSFPPRLQRTPSISSQSSLDSTPTRQSAHRGSSPQIRAFGPDGRSTSTNEQSLFHFSRTSNSPLRAAQSFDARCSSPASSDNCELSPSCLASLASSTACASTACISPKLGRCLSPLLLPPKLNNVDSNSAAPASPLGAIQPDLYRGHEGPVYINAPDDNLAFGKLHFHLKYDSHLCDLAVHLIEAQNLCPIEDGGFRSILVRLTLMPEVDNRKRESIVARGEHHPYFDQHFKFPVSRDQLPGKELIIQVMDCDRYSQNDSMGEVRINIDEMELTKSVEIWAELIRKRKPAVERPELLLSLNYLPQAERLTIVIMKAKNLETEHNPYVKMYLIVNGKRVKKKKSSLGKSGNASNPVWNEAFTFNFSQSNLQNAALEIYVVSSGGESNALSCGIGPLEHGIGRQHWHDMIHNARQPIALWHFLR
ncbi:synaptotagmin-6 [Contarinia nasturtii]|uniref:synaptotagmin-6 n=1 Tax=Contarinia nasturtii TaxID=265458 RepID=UPI0012D42807|nr:synaptotagmin-6 [Contarinia nasturtii]XP_031635715.1 synaptotagmin-6 [Contarinia nasturtii]